MLPSKSFSFNDAYRIIKNVIDERIAVLTKSGAGIEVTWGTVASLDAGATCSVYLPGETIPSSGFRLENGIQPNLLDPVRVSIDKRGNRWVDAVLSSSDENTSLVIKPREGKIRFANTINLNADTGGEAGRMYTNGNWIFEQPAVNDSITVRMASDPVGGYRFKMFTTGFMRWQDGPATNIVTLFKNGPNLQIGSGKLVGSNDTWTAPTYANGWSAYDTTTYLGAFYKKDAQGYVHLRGMIKGGTVGVTAFTMPAGYRPGHTALFAVAQNNAFGRVDINTAGAAVVSNINTSNAWVSLNGITYLAEN